MPEVHIVDIDGEQWDIKDSPLTEVVQKEIAAKSTIYSASTEVIYSQSWTQRVAHFGRVPKGKYLLYFELEPGIGFTGVMAVSNILQTYINTGYGKTKNVTGQIIEVTNEVADFTYNFQYAVSNSNGAFFTPNLIKL